MLNSESATALAMKLSFTNILIIKIINTVITITIKTHTYYVPVSVLTTLCIFGHI